MEELKLSLIQTYLKDINEALRDAKEEDIMVLFKDLYDKEQRFAKRLRATGYGRDVYVKFIRKILASRGGIKIAKSYFRARQDSYIGTVNRAIREVNPKLMHDVPVNYRFCLFAIESLMVQDKDGKQVNRDEKLASLFQDIKRLRDEIINKHLLLSLHRAGVFKKNSYAAYSEFEDLVQIANEALVISVDKYVMDDDASSFHSMAIGRIIGNLIENGEMASAATIGAHARKKLYQIRKILQKNPDFSNSEVAAILKIAEDEVVDLVGATKYQSLDDYADESGESRVSETFTADSQEPKEDQYDATEKDNLLSVLSKSFDVLSVIELKVLRLKGVSTHENNK